MSTSGDDKSNPDGQPVDKESIGDALSYIRDMIAEGGEPDAPELDDLDIPDELQRDGDVMDDDALLLTAVVGAGAERGKADAPSPSSSQTTSTQTIEQAVAAIAANIDPKTTTTDDLLSALLRPMLQEWLDKNLEPIIVRLVREELRRSGRLGDK